MRSAGELGIQTTKKKKNVVVERKGGGGWVKDSYITKEKKTKEPNSFPKKGGIRRPKKTQHTPAKYSKKSQKKRASKSHRAPLLLILIPQSAFSAFQISSHGKSCGSILVQVRYGSPPSLRSSSRKFRISGLTISFALFLISSIRRSSRFKLSRL